MTFKEAILTCLADKYFTISGRASRSEYWWFFAFNALVVGGLFLLSMTEVLFFGIFFAGIASLAIVIPSITVAIRRLHDRNMSGWWLLIAFIPNVGQLALMVLYVLPGTQGPNRFGPDPLDPDADPDDWPGKIDEDGITMVETSIPRVDRE